MACGTLIRWSPVPAGSKFKIKATGDDDAYSIAVGVAKKGKKRPTIRHDAIDPGPAERPEPPNTIEAGDRWSFVPLITFFHEPDEPTTVEAWIEDENGKIVEVDGAPGQKRLAKCDWTIDDLEQSPFMITILVTAVKE